MRFLTPFFYRTRMFVRWMNGTCIETPPQHAEGEDEPVVFSFFTDISANPAIIDLVTALSKSVQNTLGMLNKYLTRWRRYRLLWKLDKVGVHQSLQRFKPTEGVTIIVLRCVDIIVWTATVPRRGGGGVLKSFTVVHTHLTSCRCGWPRGFGTFNPSPHSWILTSVSVGSSPPSYLLGWFSNRTETSFDDGKARGKD